MVEHLGEVLEFIDVIEIVKYERFVEVRLKNVSQEVAVGLAVYEAFLKKGRIDFMMCLAGEEEFDQDLFNGVRSIGRVKDADEIFANVSYINFSPPPSSLLPPPSSLSYIFLLNKFSTKLMNDYRKI